MSFGPTNQEKGFSNNLGGAANQAQANSGQQMQQGQGLLNLGTGNTAAGTNFFNTIMNGNQAASTALLQPDINRIRGAQQGTLQAASTLMPRGGGRSGTLFSLPFQGNAQIQQLYNGLRPAAAQALTSTGLQQSGQGANLFGIGNQALNTSVQGNEAGLNWAQQQAQRQQQLAAGLGGGLFSLLTAPFTGGTSLLGGLGNLFNSSGSGYGAGATMDYGPGY